MRNKDIIDFCDVLILFITRLDKDISPLIEYAKTKNILTIIHYIEDLD
jgi:hypothetical protein